MHVVFEIRDMPYAVPVSYARIQMIEEELGSLSRLYQHFQAGDWQFCELVQLLHILIDDAGLDLRHLGQIVVAAGAMCFVPPVIRYLGFALSGAAQPETEL